MPKFFFFFFVCSIISHILWSVEFPTHKIWIATYALDFATHGEKNVPILIKSPNLIAVFHVIPGIKNASQTKEERINEHMKKIANG